MRNNSVSRPVYFPKRRRRRRRLQFTVRVFFIASLLVAVALPIAQLVVPQVCSQVSERVAEEARSFPESPASQLPWLCLPGALLLSLCVVCVTMLLRPNQAAIVFGAVTLLAFIAGVIVFNGGVAVVHIEAMKDVSLKHIALVMIRFAVFFLPIATLLVS